MESDVCYGNGMNVDSQAYRVTMHVMKLCAHSLLLSISFKHFLCPHTFVFVFATSNMTHLTRNISQGDTDSEYDAPFVICVTFVMCS